MKDENEIKEFLQESIYSWIEEDGEYNDNGHEFDDFDIRDNSDILTNDTGFVITTGGKRFHITIQEF